MKRMIILIFVVFTGFDPVAIAQKGNQVRQQKKAKQNTATAREMQRKNTTDPDTVSLLSIGRNEAYDSNFGKHFTITDPTINALQQQAYGNTRIVSPSGVVGMPRRAYGFSNGKILLRPTTAPSSGTLYGSGSVGTGTSLMGLGAGERAIGVNGKNPYSGTWLWGSKSPIRNLPPQYQDSTKRVY